LAMYRNLVTSLLEYERIETTDAKAKGVRRIAERMITLGKRGDLHARRRALRVIRSRKVTAKVFDDLAERFRDRPGGYTRIVKVRNRVGDAAPMSIIELVEGAVAAPAKPAKKKARKAKAAEKTEPAKKKVAPKRKAAAKKAEDPKKKKDSKKKAAKKSTSKKKPTKKTASKKTGSKKK
jgi:large subunit ribosomal protein L17